MNLSDPEERKPKGRSGGKIVRGVHQPHVKVAQQVEDQSGAKDKEPGIFRGQGPAKGKDQIGQKQ